MKADEEIKKVKSALDQLGTAIEGFSRPIDARNLGRFSSAGITDNSSKKVLVVSDDGIAVEHAQIKLITTHLGLLGNLNVRGEIFSPTLDRLQEQLTSVQTIAEKSLNKPVAPFVINDRSISGDKIIGGKIAKFQSTGITDEAFSTSVTINDSGLKTNTIEASNWKGEVEFLNDVRIKGNLTVESLHVNNLTSDSRLERSSSLNFIPEKGSTVVGKGLQWADEDGPSHQFVYRIGNERLWSSDDIDVQKGKVYRINNREVLSETSLGTAVTKSNLKEVGVLQGLRVVGNMNIDEFLFWDSKAGRMGLGTEAPNAMLSLASYEAEYIIDVDREAVRTGTWTTDDLHIITDDTVRIAISRTGNISLGTKNKPNTTTIHGNLNINVNHPDGDVDFETGGPVRISGRKFSVNSEPPKGGSYKIGDIVWNDSPKPTGWVGWVCVRSGTPGIWKTFGQIGS